jgi:hypothetical protein
MIEKGEPYLTASGKNWLSRAGPVSFSEEAGGLGLGMVEMAESR